jgi:hypothetical protein
MSSLRNILSKKTAKTLLGFTLGGALGYGAYQLSRDVQ